ncbi:MAG TPA: hypothetical protein VIX60_02975 [Candidatus Cybelea sp.]
MARRDGIAHPKRGLPNLGLRVGRAAQLEEILPLRGGHDDRVPQKRLEQPIQLLLMHVELKEPARVRDGVVASLQPNALCGLRFVRGKKLARRHACFIAAPLQRQDGVALYALDQF